MRVGIVGIGAISSLHVTALLKSEDKIVAFCDIDESKFGAMKNKFADRLDAVAEYTDYDKMLECEDLDVVHICTPHYLHAPMICKALEKNINVLCEKPLAISYAQIDMIEKAVKASSAQLGVCFQNRYNPSVVRLKEFFADKTVRAGSGSVIWERNASYYLSGEWRGKWDTEGGGVMINQAIHTLDLLQYVCGMPKSVIAHTSNNSLQGVIEVEDTAFGIFTVDSDRNFVVTATNAAKHTFVAECKFYADKHTASIAGDTLVIDGVVVEKSELTESIGKRVWGGGHATLISDFYDCIKSGRHFPIDFHEAKKAITLVLKMYESQGRKIEV